MKKNSFDLEEWKMCFSSVRGKEALKDSVFTILLAIMCYLLLGITPICARAGQRYALEFDGQDDYVATNEPYTFINDTGQFSASAWICVYAHAVSTGTWNSVLGTGHAGPFRVAAIQDGLIRCTWDGASRVDLYSEAVALNQWIHVLVQGDGSTLQLYVDGTVVDEVAITPQTQTKQPNFAIGTWPDNLGQRVMNGIIDDVRVWNRPLNQQEINEALDQELAGDEEGLVGYWTFNEGQGDTAYDSSPTQNHGTIAGASWTANVAPMAPPVYASAPDPADGVLDVPRDVVLSWSPGSLAIMHDVYLGLVFDDVNEATRANPLDVLVSEGQTATSYTPADVLQFGQTYYWRIDEQGDAETYKGEVWRFTVEPAGYPLPTQRITATASSMNSADEGPERTIDGSGLDASGSHSVEPTDMWLSDAADPDKAWIEFAFDKAEEFALEFDGQGDYVVTNEQYPFINETGEFATSAWVNVHQHATSTDTWNSVVGRGHAGPYRVAVIQDGKVRCTWDGASRVNVYSDPVPENQWTNILVQGDGSLLKLYIDGNLVDEVAMTPAAKDSVNFAIGTWPNNLGQRVMDGIIDDVRVWNRPLTDEGIQNSLSQALSGDEEGLVGYWTFDEGEGDTAFDRSPSQNHATISGASWTAKAVSLEPSAAASGSDTGARAPVKLDQMLVWNHNTAVEDLVGFGIKEATIQYSLDGKEWITLGENYEFAQAPGKSDYSRKTAIDFGGALAKYVKITANSNWGGVLNQFGLSEVRFLAVPVTAREPYPASGAIDVPPQTPLSWRAGQQAALHEVYLSTDEQAVIDGTAFAGTVSEPYFDATDLTVLGQTHYWKVNEVNDLADPAVWEGDVWSFTLADLITIEDFESYTDDDAAGKTVWQTWIDGFGVDSNGSQVGYLQPPYAEQTIVHGGKKSMPLSYSNTSGAVMSEATRTFDEPQNWTLHGIQTLVLHFHGAIGNTGQLYVKINNTKITYNGPAGDLAIPKWTQWNVDLTSVSANIGNVTSLSVGVEGAGASGILYVDDMHLYAVAPLVSESVWVEAEAGTVTNPMKVQNVAAGASGGHYVTMPPLTNSTDSPPTDGRVTIPFAVEGGTYQIQTRVVAPTDGDDSMWLRIEGAITNTNNHSSGWIQADLEEGENWHWSDIHSIDDGGAVVNFTLEAGQHNLEIAYREDGLLIDAFLMTKVD